MSRAGRCGYFEQSSPAVIEAEARFSSGGVEEREPLAKSRAERGSNVEVRRKLVGARGFEPRTPCAQGRCATRLRYAPTVLDYK